MKTKQKELYETPETIALEVTFEGVVCQSIGGLTPPDDFTFGDDPLSV